MADHIRTKRPDYAVVMGGVNGRSEKVHVGCPIHRALIYTITDALTEPNGDGFFHKEEILRNIKMTGPLVTGEVSMDLSLMSNAIHWDYIVKYVKDSLGHWLIPVTDRFFKTVVMIVTDDQGVPILDANGKTMTQVVNAQKALADRSKRVDKGAAFKLAMKLTASGHGGKTAGYVNASIANGIITVVKMKRTAAIANGFNDSLEQQRLIAEKNGILAALSTDVVAGQCSKVEVIRPQLMAPDSVDTVSA